MTTIDQEAIGRVPAGYRRTVLCAALLKRALAPANLPAGERLDLLEKLNGLTDGQFTAAMLAAVQPMSDVECAMIAAAMSLDGARADGRCPAADAVLRRADVFTHFAAANPSLLVALKLAVPASSNENCSGTVFGSGTVQADDQMARAKAEAVARKKLAAYGPAVEKFHTRKTQ